MGYLAISAVVYTVLLLALFGQALQFYGNYSYPLDKARTSLLMASSSVEPEVMQKHLKNALEYLEPYSGSTGMYPVPNTNYDYYKQNIQSTLDQLYALPQDSIQQQQKIQNLQNALGAGEVNIASGISNADWNYGTNPYTNPVGYALLFATILAWIPLKVGFGIVEHRKRQAWKNRRISV